MKFAGDTLESREFECVSAAGKRVPPTESDNNLLPCVIERDIPVRVRDEIKKLYVMVSTSGHDILVSAYLLYHCRAIGSKGNERCVCRRRVLEIMH